jgi:hypothetical protein
MITTTTAPASYDVNKLTVNLPQAQVMLTLADFSYPVYALWFSCFNRFLNYLAFPLFHYDQHT